MISGSVIIRNYSVVLDGKKIISGEGNLDSFLLNVYERSSIDYPKFHRMDRLAKAGFLAAELLTRAHALPPASADTAVILSNNNSSLDTDRRYFESLQKVPSPALFVYTLPNIVVGEICIRHKINGENTFLLSENFDTKLISEYVSMILEAGSSRACLAGWVDVLDEHHDVLLYLIEKEKAEAADVEAKHLEAIYKQDYGKTHRES